MQPATLVASLVGAAVLVAWRVRETRAPVTAPKLLVPPLGMATGFSMFIMPQIRVPFVWGLGGFVLPQIRVPVMWGLGAFLFGALLFSPVLIGTSQLAREGDLVFMRRSRAFLWILLALVALRLGLRAYVERFVSGSQTGGLFFLLAFGMLLPWRVVMYLRYRRLMGQRP
jgi:membrane protein CcdC involved in cytochrome C biogenesis